MGQQAQVTLGLDIAKRTLEAALWVDGHGVSLGAFDNTAVGYEAVRQAIGAQVGTNRLTALSVVLEPSGGYELGVALWAHEQPGWQVSLPNPRHMRDWARGHGRRAKTDRQDALLLAHYGAQAQPRAWHPLPSEVAELEQLLRRRDEVEGLLRAERNRQEQVSARAGQPGMPAAVGASVERVIRALEEDLEEDLAELGQQIADHLRTHPHLDHLRRQLLSVPGVGVRNVMPLLVLLFRWQVLTDGHGSAKGLVAYAGLDPQPYQSGTSVRRPATISRQGERRLRSRLYMGALGALRGHNPVRNFYDRLVGRGKAKKLALVAAARKILVWAWAVFHSDTPFDATKLSTLAA